MPETPTTADRPHQDTPSLRCRVVGLLLAGLVLGMASSAEAGRLRFVEAQFDGQGGAEGLAGARTVVASPDGAFLYVGSDTDNAVTVFARDTTSGALTWVETQTDGVAGVVGLVGIEHLTLSAEGAHLYVASKTDDALVVFARDAGTGSLTFVEAHFDGASGVDGLDGASWVVVPQDGFHVYVAGRLDNRIAVFERDAATGALTFIEAYSGSATTAVTSILVLSDGTVAYTSAGATANSRLVYRLDRDPSTGLIAWTHGTNDGLPDDELDDDDYLTLAFGPNENWVYVINHVETPSDGWISVFDRNFDNGTLMLRQAFIGSDVEDCGTGTEGDASLVFNASGDRAFANHPWGGSLVSLEHRGNGLLFLDEALCDTSVGMGGDPEAPDGLHASQSLTLVGNSLYVASAGPENAVAVVTAALLSDGFESGDTSAWSLTTPDP